MTHSAQLQSASTASQQKAGHAGHAAADPAPQSGAGATEPVLLALLSMIWLAATGWVRPLMLPDEGRYVGVAWEMMRSGDWLTPTLNGLPFFHKPPLFYWITAASMSVFGAHEWAARAAPLLGAFLAAMSLYLFVRRWGGASQARLTLLALLAQPLFFIGAQFANLDMLVAGLIGCTILLLAHAAQCLESRLPHRAWVVAAWAVAGLGLLAKGLIGVVLPAMVVGAWLLLQHRWRTIMALLWWPGPLLFLLATVPWFALMQQRFPDFLHYFFVVQHFNRFAAGGFNNVQPVWFYPLVLALFSLPALPWLLAGLRGPAPRPSDVGPMRLLMLLWLVLVTAFFSMPASKLLGYILPVMPALAWLMVWGGAEGKGEAARPRRFWNASMGLSALAGLMVVGWLSHHPRESSTEIAAALARQQRPGEPVLMLNHYYYDLPFYAASRDPVFILDRWDSAEVRRNDNWRKEIADAGDFAPAEARRLLVDERQARVLLCMAPTAWVMADPHAAAAHPFLSQAVVVAATQDLTLWRIDAGTPGRDAALGCRSVLPSPASSDPD